LTTNVHINIHLWSNLNKAVCLINNYTVSYPVI